MMSQYLSGKTVMYVIKKFTQLSLLIISFVAITIMLVPAHATDTTSISELVASMPENSWLEIPNTRLKDVGADPDKYPYVQSIMGIQGITAYSGGAYDSKRNRLVVWGGGHADYQGNEVYVFDVERLKWERLNEPSKPNLCQQLNSDGTPNSRHTYGAVDYLEHADRLFSTGGTVSCDGGGCGADITWVFNFDNKQWIDMKPRKTPETNCENFSTYDAKAKKVWWFDAPGLWSYDFDSNTWKQHNDDFLIRRMAVVDPHRGVLVVVGRGEVVAYHVHKRDYKQRKWNTTGGDALIEHWSPGLAYDPVTDHIVAWAGESVYSLNVDTKAWTEHKAKGAPSIESLNSVYGLWRYIPDFNVFIAMTGADKNIFLYKLSD